MRANALLVFLLQGPIGPRGPPGPNGAKGKRVSWYMICRDLICYAVSGTDMLTNQIYITQQIALKLP